MMLNFRLFVRAGQSATAVEFFISNYNCMESVLDAISMDEHERFFTVYYGEGYDDYMYLDKTK